MVGKFHGRVASNEGLTMTVADRISQLTVEQRAFLASRIDGHKADISSAVEKSRQLVAWFTTTDDAATTSKQLQAFVRENLPSSLRPREFLRLHSLPRTATGKTDRRRLPKVLSVLGDSNSSVDNHGTETERRLTEIWCEVLAIDGCSANDDFFRLGGDSLSMIQVLALCSKSGWHVTPTIFHENTTIKRLALAIDAGIAASPEIRSVVSKGRPTVLPLPAVPMARLPIPESDDNKTMVCLSERRDRPPLFLVPPKAVEISNFCNVVPHINAYSCFSPVMTQRDAADLLTVEEVAQRFVNYTRKVQPIGPYRLAGTCEGAYIAWEMACQLAEAGEKVQFLGIIDTPNPAAMVFKPLTHRIRLRLQSVTGQSLLKMLFHLASRFVDWVKRRARQTIVNEAHLTRAGSRMGWKFLPRSFPGNAVLFKACREARETDFTTDPAHGWDKLPTDGLHVWSLPCDRLQLLQPPFASMLAAGIQNTLAVSEVS